MKFTAVPIKDVRSLSITWPIPDLHPFYKVNVSSSSAVTSAYS